MKVIGAGFGRTGTMSMQAALETLGYPCYHMREVAQRSDHLRAWDDFVHDRAPMNWHDLFRDYQATVDFPACVYYEELLAQFPDAKVILNIRDSDRWYDSFCTLRSTMKTFRGFRFIPRVRRFFNFTDKLLQNTFADVDDRANCIRVFENHNRDVQHRVPPDRLLVFSVKEGWDPLCEFLGCDVPADTPFPHLNEGGETLAKLGNKIFLGPFFRRAAAAVVILALLAFFAFRFFV